MAKNYSSDLNNKIQNEGKNLINNNQHENIDSSNNYSSIQKNLFISSDKNQNKLKETNLTMQPKLKTKNEPISKDVLNQENDLDINMNENIEPKKKDNKLRSSFLFYTESKLFTIFRRLYKKWQLFISIFLSAVSSLFLVISILDLFNKMKNKDNDYYLCKSFIYYGEIICSILVIAFYIIYYSFNISHNNIIFIILSVLIFLLSLVYTHTYIKQKVDSFQIFCYVAYNFMLILINAIYLLMSYFINRKKFKEQQNIEDIMNFTIRNEKIEDNLKDRKKDRKNKGIELVDEENQNNNS